MSHTPNIMDASADLRRCISANIGDESFKVFFINAKKIINNNLNNLSEETKILLLECLKNSRDIGLKDKQKKEHLLLAASLLQIEYLYQLKHNSK